MTGKTNEEIIKEYGKPENWISLSDLLDLARADEREKMTQEKFAEYFNTLQGGEVASAILTQLLRRGVTDDDLRGLRLQWIKEDYCKCETPDREAGYTYCHTCHKHVSDERFEQLTNEVEDEKIN